MDGSDVPSAPASDGRPGDGSLTLGRRHARWWLAASVGTLVSLPFAWLLSYAAMLPFYLGLFFYALFGLLIGAITYRIGSPGRPYRRSAVVAGTTVIVVVAWTLSIVKESRDLPGDMATKAADDRRVILGNRTLDEYRAEVRAQVRTFLCERYPPGGTVGYIRWITTSGELSRADVPLLARSLDRGQARYWWLIRVALSVGLLAFGVGSQTLLLKLPTDPTVRKAAGS